MSVGPEKIEEVALTAGNLKVRSTRGPTGGAGEKGDLEKIGGNLFQGAKNSALNSPSLKSI